MKEHMTFDVIIVGGSYAGLSAAMALGRSLRKVLIIDAGKPCNRQTPYSHNFITQDGVAPHIIAQKAKEQVLQYPSIMEIQDIVISTEKQDDLFHIHTQNQETFTAKKLLLTSGVRDIMPNIPGFADCWGISVLHCPYCHGYEVRQQNIGIIAKGDTAMELCRLIQHWTNQLTLYTNGPSELSAEQKDTLAKLRIDIIEKKISRIEHKNGQLSSLILGDSKEDRLDAIFSRAAFEQSSSLIDGLNCQLTESGHIEVDFFQKTSVTGVYAAGDNSTPFRTVSIAVSSGTKAGAAINMELIEEELIKKPITL